MARTDDLIKRDVVDQLVWDNRVDASKVSVEVSNGTVTLRGTVPSYLASLSAESDTFSVLGVTNLRNQLEVAYPATVPVPSDEDIENNIRTKLAASPDIDLIDMDVMVNAGVVTLKGTVDTYWKKIHAEYLIEMEPGVVRIENHLAVVPTENIVDQEIANDIVRSLEAKSTVDAEDVNVRVRDGVATLSGIVPTWNARRAAYESAMYTAGVVHVDNRLTVSGIERIH